VYQNIKKKKSEEHDISPDITIITASEGDIEMEGLESA